MVNFVENKSTNKNYNKPKRTKQLVPHEIKVKNRKEKNAVSARESRKRKKEIQAQKDHEVENMASMNKKLAKKVETLEFLVESLRLFDTNIHLGIKESELCEIQLKGVIPEDKIVDKVGHIHLQIPSFFFQKEQAFSIIINEEPAFSIEESFQDNETCSTFSECNN